MIQNLRGSHILDCFRFIFNFLQSKKANWKFDITIFFCRKITSELYENQRKNDFLLTYQMEVCLARLLWLIFHLVYEQLYSLFRYYWHIDVDRELKIKRLLQLDDSNNSSIAIIKKTQTHVFIPYSFNQKKVVMGE
jgi:dephospho-CoA kinase